MLPLTDHGQRTAINQPSPLVSLQRGYQVLLSAPVWQKTLTACFFLLAVFMLPFGRTAPDAGGLLAPLTVDSGLLFRQKPAIDFFSIYDAGSRLIRGEDPYGVNNVPPNGEGLRTPYVATFRYLPITAGWLAVPLNILPPWGAYRVWVFLNLLFLIANFLLCTGRRPAMLPLLAAIWFAWFPVIAELHMGQFSLFMATLLLWGFDAFFSGRRGLETGWLLAVLLKVYPLAMAPSLFLWKRRTLAIGTLALVVLSTLAWKVAVPSDLEKGMIERGIGGRVIGITRQPYAGAQGVQEMVNALLWKARGRSFGDSLAAPPRPLTDPTFLVNAVILGAFSALCVWVLWRTRRQPSLAAIGIFWLSWFYTYYDAWEHHYVLLQALIALLLVRDVISWRTALVCYLSAGGPSLWWLWQRTGYQGNLPTELIGTLYFLQRPVAVLLLTVVLGRVIATEHAHHQKEK